MPAAFSTDARGRRAVHSPQCAWFGSFTSSARAKSSSAFLRLNCPNSRRQVLSDGMLKYSRFDVVNLDPETRLTGGPLRQHNRLLDAYTNPLRGFREFNLRRGFNRGPQDRETFLVGLFGFRRRQLAQRWRGVRLRRALYCRPCTVEQP
jgi:hypothetical protein